MTEKELNPAILDVTVRDGSYALDYQFETDQVAGIAGALDRTGIEYIEVSHGCGLGAGENLGLAAKATDAEYVGAAKGAVRRAKIGVIAGAAPVTQFKDIDTIIEDVDFIRYFTNCANPRGIENNLNYTKKRRPDLPVFLQLTNSTRRPAKEIVKAGLVAQDLGVEIIYVVDTTSHFLPEEVSELVSELTSRCKIGIGFHGHDSLRMAVANTLAAVSAGAASIDASLRGIGRGGGNAQLEIVVSLMQRFGLRRDLDLKALVAAGTELIEPIMPPRRGVDGADLVMADSNISLYPLSVFQMLCEKAHVSFAAFVKKLGGDGSVVEPQIEDVKRALNALGADADKALREIGVG